MRAVFRDLDQGGEVTLESDAVFLATGYRYETPVPVLAARERSLRHDADGNYAVPRDYRIEARDDFAAGSFLQGFSERTHGFSEVLLSLMPLRAAEIVAALVPETTLAGAR